MKYSNLTILFIAVGGQAEESSKGHVTKEDSLHRRDMAKLGDISQHAI